MCHFGLSVATWSSLVEERADQSPRRLLMYRSWLSCQSKGPPAVVSLSLFILFLKKKKKGRATICWPPIDSTAGRDVAATSADVNSNSPRRTETLSLSLPKEENSVAKLDRHTKKQKTHSRVIQNVLIFIFFFFVQMNRPIQVKPADSDNRGGKCGVARLFSLSTFHLRGYYIRAQPFACSVS